MPKPNKGAVEFTMLAVAQCEPSKLNPRKTVSAAGLEELTQSILGKGVLQPILVRPVGFPGHNAAEHRYEVIAGDRRLRAARAACLATIPARIMSLTDADALELMVTENEQREDVGLLEKAEGYRVLIEQHGFKLEVLAARLGKSPSTIRGLLKLQGLPQFALEALSEGRLPLSTAQLVARIPGANARSQAAFCVLDDDSWAQCDVDPKQLDADRPVMSFRNAKELIERAFMRELKSAPFSRKSLDLVPAAGSCEACPKRTGNNREEFPGSRADVCTDPDCYSSKVAAHAAVQQAAAEAAGRKVLSASESAKLFPMNNRLAFDAPFVDLAQTNYDGAEPPTYQKLLGAAAEAEIVLAPDREGRLHKLVPKPAAKEILRRLHPELAKIPNKSWADDNGNSAGREAKAAKIAARLANTMVRTQTHELFGLMVGVRIDSALPKLHALLEAMSRNMWSDALAVVLKTHTATAMGDLLKDATIPALLGLLAEMIAARISFSWGRLNNGTGDKDFWAAFGVDPKKLIAQESAKLSGEAKAKRK